MKIGIVAATPFEIAGVSRFIQQQAVTQHEYTVLISGVGMLLTAFYLTAQLHQHSFDLLVQAGIGGAFSDNLSLTDVVLIQQEVVGDLGVEEEGFKDVFDMGFAQKGVFPFTGKSLVNPHILQWNRLSLPLACGLTVNEITTRPERIAALQQKYGCEVESMEGAAFHYACLQQKTPFLQIRSVSNRVGERNKKNWRLKEAIQTLNEQVIRIIKQINKL